LRAAGIDLICSKLFFEPSTTAAKEIAMPDDQNGTDKAPERQMDDNIDDMGRKPDGSTLDQPGTDKLDKSKDPSKKDVEPASYSDSSDESLGL
jgi:hypothetical protein